MSSPGPEPTLRELAELIRGLTKQVETLWQAVDDLREEIFAEFRRMREEPLDDEPDNDNAAASPPLHVTSLPRDACDPEFHRKVNQAAETLAQESPQPAPPPAARTLDELIERFQAEPVAESFRDDEWGEDSKLREGKVAAVDGDLFDWLGASLATEEVTASYYVLVDAGGRRAVMWTTEGECFVRRLTAEEEREFERLSGVEDPSSSRSASLSAEPPSSGEPAKSQRALW